MPKIILLILISAILMGAGLQNTDAGKDRHEEVEREVEKEDSDSNRQRDIENAVKEAEDKINGQ